MARNEEVEYCAKVEVLLPVVVTSNTNQDTILGKAVSTSEYKDCVQYIPF